MTIRTLMTRFNLHLPRKMLARVRRKVLDEAASRGEPLSVSAWLRELIEEALKEGS